MNEYRSKRKKIAVTQREEFGRANRELPSGYFLCSKQNVHARTL